jgi:hypothetical protein
MKSGSVPIASMLCVLILSEGRALSQSEKEATTAQVVAAITGLTKNQSLTLYFEATMDGKPVGFSTASLSATGSDQSASLRYQVEMAVSLGNGARTEGSLTASLNKSFEPMEVELRREVTAPNGKRQSTVERAEILDKEVLLTRETDGGARTERSVSRPESPFVFAVEFIIQRADLKAFPAFAIRELNPQEGSIIVQHFKAESESGRVRRLVSREDDGSVGYVFEIDAKGELVSWTEPPLPVVSKRCSRERFEELRKSLQGR